MKKLLQTICRIKSIKNHFFKNIIIKLPRIYFIKIESSKHRKFGHIFLQLLKIRHSNLRVS